MPIDELDESDRSAPPERPPPHERRAPDLHERADDAPREESPDDSAGTRVERPAAAAPPLEVDGADLSGLYTGSDAADDQQPDDLSDLGDVETQTPSELSPADAERIRDYTDEGSAERNTYERASDVASPEQQRRSDQLSASLESLPEYHGRTFRGTDLPEPVLADIDRTSTFQDPAFLSTSKDLEVAQEFRAGGNTLMHIDGTSGRDVSSLSAYASEAEVLFDKGTAFSVTSKEWNPGGYWDIYCEERR